eukprot:scaffold144459_cov33-Tisochrysis_lutea.AAC.2
MASPVPEAAKGACRSHQGPTTEVVHSWPIQHGLFRFGEIPRSGLEAMHLFTAGYKTGQVAVHISKSTSAVP